MPLRSVCDNWSVETYTPELLEQLISLWIDSWQHTMPEIDFEARRSWFSQRLQALHYGGSQTFCALAKRHDMIGFITLNRSTRYIDQLAIAPERFGSSLAPGLLAVAKQQSPECLELHVNQANHRAVRFYEREGFQRSAAGINPHSGLKVWAMKWRG
jgi:putative acetyltransferase